MTPEQLKASILQYAVQGRLVEQIKDEGNATALIAELKEAKESLIKSKVIKREKDIEDKELEPPFDIPDTWEWVRVADCISNKTGLSYNKGNLEVRSDNMIRVLRGGNIADMNYTFKTDDVMISKEFVKSELYLKKNILITPAVTSLEHIGKMGRIEQNYCDTVVGGFVLMLTPHIDDDILSKYLLIAFSSPYFRDRCRKIVNKSGQAFYNLSREKMMQLFVPIPPLAEQHRIVIKIEELLPFVDRYAASYEKLEQVNAKFPEDMKKSILQYAIQGKLVEQRPEEGTAEELYKEIQEEKQKLIKEGKIKKEKPLAEITEDETPFDIPDSWKWVHLNNIASSGLGKTLNKSTDTGEEVPYLCSINVYWEGINLDKVKTAKFDDQAKEKYKLQKGDLLICEGGEAGRSAIWDSDEEMYYQNALHRVRFYGNVDAQYMCYVLECYKKNGTIANYTKGIGIQHLVQASLNSIWLPLPPLEEQQRIVAKIEELLPYCDQLLK